MAISTTCPSSIEPFQPNPDLEEWAYSWGGAGQKAAFKNAWYLDWLIRRWGTPIYPDEPVSLAVTRMQLEISEYTHRHRVWLSIEQHTGLPVAREQLTELGWWLDTMWEHLQDLEVKEIPTVYSKANNPAELEALLSAPPPAPKFDYKALKERIDIVEYAGRYTKLRKVGKTFAGRCPIREERTASFYVYPETQSFYCFGCQTGGDVINFAKAIGDQIG